MAQLLKRIKLLLKPNKPLSKIMVEVYHNMEEVCCLCQKNLINTIFLPCMHVSYCMDCVSTLKIKRCWCKVPSIFSTKVKLVHNILHHKFCDCLACKHVVLEHVECYGVPEPLRCPFCIVKPVDTLTQCNHIFACNGCAKDREICICGAAVGSIYRVSCG